MTESWLRIYIQCDVKEIGCFQIVVLENTLKSPLDNKEIKSVNQAASGLKLKLKLQYFDHLTGSIDSLSEESDSGKDWEQEERGMTQYDLVRWHYWLNDYDFEQTPGDTAGQGSLACWSPWSHKWSDMT